MDELEAIALRELKSLVMNNSLPGDTITAARELLVHLRWMHQEHRTNKLLEEVK